jgi:PAS domain S-box-containing protein
VVDRLRSGKTATLRRDIYVQEHWYEQAVTYLPSTNSYRLYARDITERKQAEEALNRSEEQYRTLYEEAPNAYFSIGVDGIIQRVNTRAAELLGYRLEELIGKPVSDLYADTPNGKARAAAVFKKFLAGKETRDEELEMRRADGSSVWVSLTVKPILDNGGKVIASRSAVTDITQRKRVESIKDEFIGLVSHELKTPLTVVTGAVKTAMDERVSPEERHELLEDAAWGAESLDNILNNLLELSRYQADRLRLDKELVSIKAIADKATRAARNQHPRHVFSVDIPRGLRPLHVDPVRLERILTNLIDNAAKYSPEGSEVRIFARRENDETVIGVSDQGVGISPEDRKNLFEPFRRLGIETKTKGIGLGLVVCKRLVEAHGGRIWLESKPGTATTFFFTLGKENQAHHS